MPLRDAWGSTGLVRRQEGKGKAWVRPFIVVFLGRNGQGGMKRFRIG